jgi:hypothetical protein
MKSEEIYFSSEWLNRKEFILVLSAENLHTYAHFIAA